MTGKHLTHWKTDVLIETMVRERGARNQWSEAEKSVYDGLLRGLVRIAHQEVLRPGLSLAEDVIGVILDSRLGCLDEKEFEAYTNDLRQLVFLAKEEKANEIRQDVVRAGFIDQLATK